MSEDKLRDYLIDICDLVYEALHVDPEDVEGKDKVIRQIHNLQDRIRLEGAV